MRTPPLTRRPLRPVIGLAALALVGGAAFVLPTASTAAAVDPIDGPQTSGDSLFPNVGNGGYDALNYDLDIAWTPGATIAASTIDATAAITAATTGAPLKSFSFDFESPTMTISSVTVNGVAAEFVKDENAQAIRHKLVVTPATPVEGAFTTVVKYAGVPVRHVDADGSFEGWNVTGDGATFVNQPIGSMTGYPNNNTPADKATYDISIDIPNTITNSQGTGAAAAASNGELISRVPNQAGTRTTWNWRQTEPMASELTMISIGKYDVIESQVALADGRTLPEWSFVDSVINANTKTSIRAQLARWKSVIDGLASIYGPYPGNSLGAVVDIVPSAINYALETQDRSFFPGSISAGTFVHEAAHQWYGNSVAPTDWNDLYINEGMATWAPTYFANEVADPATSGASTQGTYYTSWASNPADNSSWLTPPARILNAAQLYGYQTYTRSAQFWEALRLSIGETDFFALIKEWQNRYAGQSHGTDDLIALAEEISGEDLEAFFQDWIYDADKPSWPQRYDLKLSADASSEPLAAGETVTYTVQAANKGYVALTSSVAEIDLADVLDDASLDATSLPAGLALDGDTLVWTLPNTPRGGQQRVEFTVEVDDTTSDETLSAAVASRTLGGHCDPTATCSSTLDVPVQPVVGTPDPSAAGVVKVGRDVEVRPGTWDGTTSVQWFRNSSPIEGATDARYTITAADLGRDLTAEVTYSAPGYTSIAKRAELGEVGLGVQTRRTSVPTIDGVARVGRVLAARPGAHDPGVTLSYQWYADGDAIGGATGQYLRIPARYRGDTLRVRVTGTKPGYVPVTNVSRPTARVS